MALYIIIAIATLMVVLGLWRCNRALKLLAKHPKGGATPQELHTSSIVLVTLEMFGFVKGAPSRHREGVCFWSLTIQGERLSRSLKTE